MLPNVNNNLDDGDMNAINATIEAVRKMGSSIQNIVAKGQLTPKQYAELIQAVNGLIAKGNVSISDINKNKGLIDQSYLSKELLQQMAGNTPVNAVPADDSITTEKYVNNSVTNEKLDQNFLYRRRIEPDESIDTIEVDGTYIITAGNVGTFPNDDNSLWGMEVITIPVAWTHQTLFKLGDPSIKYTRLYRGGSAQELTQWVKVITNPDSIDNHSIETVKLGKNFLHRRRIDIDEDVKDFTEDGTYIITAGNTQTSFPNNDTSAWVMDVKTIPANWTYQTIHKLSNPETSFVRLVRLVSSGEDTVGDWKALKGGSESEGLIYKVLFVGNSYSLDATEYINNIADSVGINVQFNTLYRDGERLSSHYENALSGEKNYFYYRRSAIDGVIESNRVPNYSFDDGVLDEEWDLILFQQRSGDAPDYSTYQPYLSNLKDYIINLTGNSDIKFGLHQTWSRASTNPNYFENMYTDIVGAYQQAMSDIDSSVIVPSGTAIENARANSYLSTVDDELTEDGSHLGELGDYIASLAIFESLLSGRYKKDIFTDVTYKPSEISNFHAYLAKLTVKNAVLKPFRVTRV